MKGEGEETIGGINERRKTTTHRWRSRGKKKEEKNKRGRS
jgi:hypothetical protein